MLKFIQNLIADESGATAVEYGLIAALISIAAISAMMALNVSLGQMFNTVADKIEGALPKGGSTN